MFDSILNQVFGPMLRLGPLAAVLLISLIIALIITIIYKYTTNQAKMAELKAQLKQYQAEMKQSKDNPQRLMELQKAAMQINMKFMSHSLKPTLITFLPIIIIFSWLNAHLAYMPITPGQEFTTTAFFTEGTEGSVKIIVPEQIVLLSNATQQIKNNKAEWNLKGEAGEYLLEYKFNNKTYRRELLITEKQEYKQPIQRIKNSELLALQINNQPMKLINFFGWRIGWLGTYIIASIIFSMLLRKIFKLH